MSNLKFCDICGSLLKGRICRCGEDNIISKGKKYVDESFSTIRDDLNYLKSKIFTLNLPFTPEQKAESVRIRFKRDNRTSRYNPSENTIHFGVKYIKYAPMSYIKKTLLHEFLHSCGLNHNRYNRQNFNFYSNISKDEFTNEIMEKFGWIPPTKEEIANYHRIIVDDMREIVENKIENAKYRVFCIKCNFEVFRVRRCNSVDNPEDYRCPNCKSELDSEILA